MRKKQDIMWEQSTLWESVEKWVTKYLKKNHSEYRELQVKAMRIVDENPARKSSTADTDIFLRKSRNHIKFIRGDSFITFPYLTFLIGD